MKKLAKYAGITACVGLFIFLMLPFLEPPTLNDGKTATEKSGQLIPQIFTSNPLTDIVKRIARFFGKDDTPSQQAQRPANRAKSVTPHTRYAANSPEEEQELLAAAAGGAAVIPADPNAADPTSYQVQDENGEWVLVQQRAPEAAQAGMHEISVKEDAYERYVKQERTARFTPAVAMPQTVAVPDSKLARLFQPIKRFFGFGEETPTAVASGALGSTIEQDTTLAAATTGRSERLGTNNDKTPIFQRPKALEADIDPQQFRAIRNASTISKSADEAGANLRQELDIWDTIKESADWVANSVPSTGSSKEDELRRNQVWQNIWNKNKTKWATMKKEDMEKRRQGQDAKDPSIVKHGGCNVNALLSGTLKKPEENGLCHEAPGDPLQDLQAQAGKSQTYLQELLQTDETHNTERYYEKNNRSFIGAPFIPILGVADNSALEQIDAQDDEKFKDVDWATKKLYRYMLEQNDCQNNSCLWVANTEQPLPEDSLVWNEIKETVTAAGFSFSGDPFNVYPQMKQAFIQEEMDKYDQANQDNEKATPEKRKEYEQLLNQAAPPYVLYSAANARQLANQTRWGPRQGDAHLPHNAVVYFTDAADAEDFSEKYGYDTLITYGTIGHRVLSKIPESSSEIPSASTASNEPADNTSVESRASKLVEDVANAILLRRKAEKEIKQEAAQEAVQNTIPPKVQQTMRDIQDKIKKGVAQDITLEPTVQ